MNSEPTAHLSRWWDRIAETHASRVWDVIQDAGLPHHAGFEVSRLTWMRLADHLARLEPGKVEAWLCETARREAARSAGLMGVMPQLGLI